MSAIQRDEGAVSAPFGSLAPSSAHCDLTAVRPAVRDILATLEPSFIDVWRALTADERRAACKLLWSLRHYPHRDRLAKRAASAMGGVSSKVVRTSPADRVARALAGLQDLDKMLVRDLVSVWYRSMLEGEAARFAEEIEHGALIEDGNSASRDQASAANGEDRLRANCDQLLNECNPNDAVLLLCVLMREKPHLGDTLRAWLGELATRVQNALSESAAGLSAMSNAGNGDGGFSTRLEALRTRFGALAERLHRAANAFERESLPDDNALGEELASVLAEFSSVEGDLLHAIEDFGIPDLPAKESGRVSLGTLAEMAVTVAEAKRQRQSASANISYATEVVNAALALLHVSDSSFKPLATVHREAAIIQERLAAADGAIALALTDRRHPLTLLARVVRSVDEMEDAALLEADAVLREAYGPLLAMAALRGRLRINPDAAPKVIAPEVETSSIGRPSSSAAVETDTLTAVSAQSEPHDSAPSPTSSSSCHAPECDSVDASDMAAAARIADGAVSALPDDAPPNAALRDPDGIPAGELFAGLTDDYPRQGKEHVAAARVADALSDDPPTPVTQPATGSIPSTAELPEAILARLQAAWTELGTPQPEFAVHLSAAAVESAAEMAVEIPSEWNLPDWLATAVSVAPWFVDAHGPLSRWLQERLASQDLPEVLGADDATHEARQLLLAAALLRPALLAPGTGAYRLLNELRLGGPYTALWELCRHVAHFGVSGRPITPEIIRHVQSQADWETALHNLRDEAAAWLESAASFSNVYQAASNVWRRWTDRNGAIATLLRPVIEDDASALQSVRNEVDRLSNDTELRREVEKTDREIAARKRRVNPIQAKALQQLINHAGAALDLARRWITLREFDPGSREGRRLIAAQELRNTILKSKPLIERSFTKRLEETADIRLQSAIRRCAAALDDLAGIFTRVDAVQRPEPSVAQVLAAPLLRFAHLRISPEWGLPGLRLIADTIARVESADDTVSHPDWNAVIDERLKDSDFIGVQLTIEYLQSLPASGGVDLDKVRQRRDDAFGFAHNALVGKIKQQRSQVERAVFFGVIGEAERAALLAEVEEVWRVAADGRELLTHTRFEEQEARLRQVDAHLDAYREAAVSDVRQALEEERDRIPPNSKFDARIQALINRGDVLTAQEYIEQIRSGRDPDTLKQEVARADLTQFLSFCETLDSETAITPVAVTKAVASRGRVASLDFSKVSDQQAIVVQEALKAWYNKQTQRNNPDHKALQTLFQFLGFAVHSTKTEREDATNRFWSVVETATVGDPALCPVPAFGSAAQGRYHVLWAWGEPLAEDIVAMVKAHGGSHPVVVLHFGRMPLRVRLDLRGRCRDEGVRCVVLDETLMLYLAAQGGARMSTFFACTLPFTFLVPYQTTAGEVPPELFVGRRQERLQLQDIGGPCFVYGGRQLGKTALLRDVERAFADRHLGQVAVYMDLKAEGLGIVEPPSHLWRHLVREFRTMGIVDQSAMTQQRIASLTPNDAYEMLASSVTGWLREPRRRILLLLDEADRFFERDAVVDRETDGPFAVSDKLKGLMERTNRRFKVVFAGLHNVKRTTRLENHPLAHFGSPICVGPLLGSGEWRSAAELVRRPLTAMGYHIDEDLITRVLSQTNYYPSLIQLYCDALMRHVLERSRGRIDSRSTPPVAIASEQLEAAYTSKELRTVIREKLSLTLQLDPRYRVLALVLARQAHRSQTSELSVAEIREEALYWWGDGFGEETTEDSFRALLDEMVGLGVLREADAGRRYALRSVNVLDFMGSEDEIETELISLPTAETYRGYDPFVYRRPWKENGRTDSSRRSPLTVQQELELAAPINAVSIVCGTSIGGLGDLLPFLRTLPGRPAPDAELATGAAREDLTEALARASRYEDGAHHVIVTEAARWTETWVHDAFDVVSTRTSKRRFIRVSFIADPERVWTLVESRPELAKDFARLGVQVFTLQPWREAAIVQWAEEMGVSATTGGFPLPELKRITGGWPALLGELAEQVRSKTAKNLGGALRKYSAALDEPERVENLLAAFGLGLDLPLRALKVLADLNEPVTEDDLIAVADKELPIHQVLQWADWLGLTLRGEQGVWRLDKLAQRVLSQRSE